LKNNCSVDYDYVFRIALVGESNTGKTTSMRRILSLKNPNHAAFDPDTDITIGVDMGFYSEYFGPQKDRVQIILVDTAGSEKYRSLAQNFFRLASSIVLMYDVTDRYSFDQIKDYWFPEVMKHFSYDEEKMETLTVMLIGNKTDLIEKKNQKRQVPYSTAFDFADEKGILFVETSALSGPNSVRTAFDTLANRTYQKFVEQRERAWQAEMSTFAEIPSPSRGNGSSFFSSSSSSVMVILQEEEHTSKKKSNQCCE
jgi:small GTP-binding protein